MRRVAVMLGFVLAVAACRDLPTTPSGDVPLESISPPWSEPNFVVVMTDDQTLESLQHMPRVLRLIGDEGIAFTQAITTTSLCCPSRVSLLRGQYTHNHQVFTNNNLRSGGWAKVRAMGLESSTIATALQAAGYRTALMGRYINKYFYNIHYRTVPPGWDHWIVSGNPVRQYAMDGALYSDGGGVHQNDFLAARARTFIEAQAGPFLLMIWPTTPHYPSLPAVRHRGMFANHPVPHAPSRELNVRDSATADALYRRRLEALQSVDEMVESVIDALDDKGVLGTTYVFFLSDNGLLLGEHGVSRRKNLHWEETLRIPFLVRGPGITRGITSSALVANTDVAPTIAELAGVTMGHVVDGRSLSPLFASGTATPWRRVMGFEHYRWDKSTGTIGHDYGIRDGAFSLARRNGRRHFYDLVADPYQLRNLTSLRRGLANTYEAAAITLSTCAGAGCRAAEDRAP
ncbi:MAG TPA: sulfatase [bacterium]|nr:sulfatase [bacterium]